MPRKTAERRWERTVPTFVCKKEKFFYKTQRHPGAENGPFIFMTVSLLEQLFEHSLIVAVDCRETLPLQGPNVFGLPLDAAEMAHTGFSCLIRLWWTGSM